MTEETNGPTTDTTKNKDHATEPQPVPDYFDQLIRLKAEFENYRKRVDREKPELYKLGRAELLLKLLPIYDLLRAAHREVQAGHSETPLAKGMEGIFKQFEKLFREEGVAVMEPAGKAFDPSLHEVLGTIEKEGVSDDTVVEVLEDGYLLGDKLLRPARVRIARAVKTAQA